MNTSPSTGKEVNKMKRLQVLSRHLQVNGDTSTTRHGSNDEDSSQAGAAPLNNSTNGVSRNNTVSTVSSLPKDLYYTLTGDLKFYARKHGGDLVGEVLKAHGVKFVFTLSGGHISPCLVASEQRGIRIIDVRHEVNTVFAADSVARLTGIPGVAMVTAGPGVSNCCTALKNAQMAESPVVLIGGAAATLSKDRGALQDINQMDLMQTLCKFTATVTAVRDIVPTLRRAFYEAASGVPGPVFVELPLDVLYPITEASGGMNLTERAYAKDVREDSSQQKRVIVPDDAGTRDVNAYLKDLPDREAVFLNPDPAKSKSPWYVNSFMQFKLRSLFAGAWGDTEFGPLPVNVPQPQISEIQKASTLLAGAKNPVLLIGSQATVSGPGAVDALVNSVNKLGIPTFLGGMARGLLGPKSSIHIRQNRGKALARADVVILAGAVCDFRLQYGQTFSKASKIVSINRSKASATMNAGLFWNPTLVSESDPCQFLRKLSDIFAGPDGVGPNTAFESWAAELKAAEDATEKGNAEKAEKPAYGRIDKSHPGGPTRLGDESAQRLINPLKLLRSLDDELPDDSILVADGGDFVATAAYILRPRGPLRWLDPGAFGTLGVGMGFALGAKLCRPESEVYLLWGDGSSGYSLAEFDTFARHNLSVIAIVGNDACWRQIEREQLPMFGSDVACPLSYRSYDQVATGYGGTGFTISDANEDFPGKIKEAQRLARQGTPTLVNALIGSTDFREGSISV